MTPEVAYWDRGVGQVPRMTGAADLLDARDVRAVAAALAIPLPFGTVLDVGCGTGRVAPLCRGYLGVDVAPSAVAYCRERGLAAATIRGPEDLPPFQWDWVLALSLFTHIDAAARRAYLAAFAPRAPHLLVDVIPGTGGGDMVRWSADVQTFEADLHAAGYVVRGTAEIPDSPGHRYYDARRIR